jgi:peptide/nickel transport system permease protein
MAVATPADGIAPTQDPARTLARRRSRRDVSWISLGWLAIVVAAGIAAPLVAPQDPVAQHLSYANRAPGFHAAGQTYLLGTDNLGRDLLSRLIYGIRPMVEVAVLSVLIAGAIGLVLGVTAAMGRGWVETLIMRVTDIQLAMPLFILALLLAFTLRPGLDSSIIAIVVATWPYYARLVRTDVIRTRNSAFVQLARVAGRRGLGLTVRHVIPNSLNSFAALCVLNLGVAVTIGAALSFLGVGIQPPAPDWGNMIAQGTQYLNEWWLVTLPGLAFCSVVIAINSVGNFARRRLQSDASADVLGGVTPVAMARRLRRARRQPRPAAGAAAGPASAPDALLHVAHLTVVDPAGRPVVADVGISLQAGQVLGLIGESGSGKSTLCRSIIGLLSPGLQVTAGELRFAGRAYAMADAAQEELQGRHIGMVMQDPLTSLNPVRRVGMQMGETRAVHRMETKDAIRQWVRATLGHLGFPHPEATARSYPHELSGGMRQRVCVGIAFSGAPAVVLADEPTTALDVSLQGRVLRLLADHCSEYSAALVLVSHDVRVIRDMADSVTVMLGGKVLESGPAAAVLNRPASPYTKALLDSVPDLDPESRFRPLRFIPPAAGRPSSSGCPFAGRCQREVDRCGAQFPSGGHSRSGSQVWCWNPIPAEVPA